MAAEVLTPYHKRLLRSVLKAARHAGIPRADLERLKGDCECLIRWQIVTGLPADMVTLGLAVADDGHVVCGVYANPYGQDGFLAIGNPVGLLADARRRLATVH